MRQLSCTLHQGVVAVAGANGAGKSTLLRALATLVPVARGQLEVAGADLTQRRGRALARRRLGFLGQHPAFPGSFRVEEAVRYAAWLHRVEDPEPAVERIMERLALGPIARDRLADLSGGTRHRALLAQAMVHDPAVLLLDEPTVGMDVEHRVQLRQDLRAGSEQRLVVVSTHLTEDIELLADRVLVLRDGQVVFDGDPAALAEAGEAGASSRLRPIESALRALAGFDGR